MCEHRIDRVHAYAHSSYATIATELVVVKTYIFSSKVIQARLNTTN